MNRHPRCGYACAIILGTLLTLGAEPKKPAPTRESILHRFAEEFVLLTPGRGKFPASFRIGSTTGPDSEKPVVTITLREPFALARYEVTQELYQAVMGANPSKWKGPRNSVEMVSWDDANAFCRKATTELRRLGLLKASEEIRLPSEAEWEYACRAGGTGRYSFGDDVSDLAAHAWYKANSKGVDPPVGRKKPNAWGLYDMHGYVWEWCADTWSPTLKEAAADGRPRRQEDAKERVVRGGSWADPADSCRCGYRGHRERKYRSDTVGFRCVRAAVPTKEDR